jgi:hypothetical protein
MNMPNFASRNQAERTSLSPGLSAPKPAAHASACKASTSARLRLPDPAAPADRAADLA